MKSIPLMLILLSQSIAFAQTPAEQSNKYLGERPPGMTPVKFAPGVVSLDDQYEFGSVFSNNGNEFYYAANVGSRAEIRFMELTKGGWTKPVTILSGQTFSYNDPMLSPDESKLFFISDKPLDGSEKKKDYDIWYVEKNGDHWSAPINAGTAINSGKNEYYVSFSKNGTMYFSSNRMAKEERTDNYDIYASAAGPGGFQQPLPLEATINTKEYEADVFVARDGSYLIFCGTHPDGYGAGDLYISFKKQDGTWTKAKNMGETINTPGHELCPFVTADGKYFFYTSNRDIYWVDAKIINSLR